VGAPVGAREAGPAPDDDALEAFRRAAWLNPEEADYHFILGEALMRLGRGTEAVAAFEEATWRAPGDPHYHMSLGDVLRALKRDAEAASAYREAARLAPADARALGALGATLVVLGQVDEAIRALRQAVLAAPSDADARFNLGLGLVAAGEVDEAIAVFREAAALAPGDAGPRAELGGLLHDRGRDPEAYAAFSEARQLDPRCLEDRPRLKAAYEASTVASLKEGIRSEIVGSSRRSARWALRPLAAVMELLPGIPTGALGLATVALLALSAWVTLRLFVPYWNHYTFKDEISEIGHAAIRDDTEIRARVFAAAERHHLASYVQAGEVTIETRRTWRKITCRYAVPVALLPGLVSNLRFSLDVEEPVLIDGEEKIFF